MYICGIDYGSSLAGTTVICTLHTVSGKVTFAASEKRKNADVFLKAKIRDIQPSLICIDAPLSLPGVYKFPEMYTDYFFRLCDRQLNAMSPMFLGGLTARAMQLKAALEAEGYLVYETYPSAQAKRINLYELGYKQSKEYIISVAQLVCESYPGFTIHLPDIISWHHLDALLAMIGAFRYHEKQCIMYGDEEEGVIII